MKIVELKVDNFLRVEAAEVRPDGSLVVIAGPNGAGKSTLLNAMLAALQGDSLPDEPIRKGADRASVVLRLEGEQPAMLVERVFTEKGSRLRVTSPDGKMLYRSPQALLSEMAGALTFDPLEFAKMAPKKRAEVLRKLVGLDTADLDKEHAELYAERTVVNRQIRDMGSVELDAEDDPGDRIDIAEINRGIEELRAKDRERAQLADGVTNAERNLMSAEQFVGKLAGDLTRYAREYQEAKEKIERQLAEAKVEMGQRDELVSAARAKLEATPDVTADIESKVGEIDRAEKHNATCNIWARAVEKLDRANALRADVDKKTDRLSEIATEKEERIAALEMPIEGLGLDTERGVLFNDFPFDQSSQAETLRASAAIGMALNPTLRVLRIKSGNDLDSKNLARLGEMAELEDYQFWIERVADEDSGVGFYIEDGRLAAREGDEPAAEEADPPAEDDDRPQLPLEE